VNAIALPDGRLHIPTSEIPDVAAFIRAQGWLTTAEGAWLDRMRNAQFVLVRIDGEGERWRCSRCNRKHTHFTTMCIERPFRGLEHGLYGYWRNVGAANPADLTPDQRAKLALFERILSRKGMPTPHPLAQSNPRTARELGTRETDADIGAALLGSIDPISREKALFYADQINARARRIVVRI
jgi:hypothetical protein